MRDEWQTRERWRIGGTITGEFGNAKTCRQLVQSQTARIRQELNAEDAILLCRVLFRWPAAIVR